MLDLHDIHVERIAPTEQRKTHAPHPPPGATIIDEPARLIDADTGDTVGLHLVYGPGQMTWGNEFARALGGIKFEAMTAGEYRLSGIISSHRTFGFAAPVPLRRRYGCSKCRFDDQYPRLSVQLADAARFAWAEFESHAPEQAAAHREIVEPVSKAWWFGGTPWTSGIINNTSALPYHRDAGNLPGSWSAMYGFRRGTSGGLLHLADYDLWLAIPHRSLSIFDGQSVLHAVTPFHLDGSGAYRYTLVYYAKSAMKSCLEGDEEIRRAQRLRSEAEDRQAAELAERIAEHVT